MITQSEIEEIIRKHLDLDTVHIEYHRESIDMVGHMAAEIRELIVRDLGTVLDEVLPPFGTRYKKPILEALDA